LVASYDLWSGNGASLFSKAKVIKEKAKKKDKWGSIQCKQTNDIYSAKINKWIKGTVFPGAHTGPCSIHLPAGFKFKRESRQRCWTVEKACKPKPATCSWWL